MLTSRGGRSLIAPCTHRGARSSGEASDRYVPGASRAAAGTRLLQCIREVDKRIARQVAAGPWLRMGLLIASCYLLVVTAAAVLTPRLALFPLLIGFGILVLFLEWWAYLLLVCGALIAHLCAADPPGAQADPVLLTTAVVGMLLSIAVRKFRDVTQLERRVELQNIELQTLVMERTDAEKAREALLTDLSAQLTLARRLQEQLMAFPETAQMLLDGMRLHVSGVSRASKQVGGDFYRILRLSPTSVAVIVGDVMGKGVAAALVMSMTVALFEECARQTRNPAEILSRVNQRLHSDLGNDTQTFVTAIVIVIDSDAGCYRVADAGHEQPLLLRRRRTRVLGGRPGLPLGVDGDERYVEHIVRMASDDRIVAYTDGLVENEDQGQPGMGRRALRRTLAGLPCDDAAALVERVGTSGNDDVTLVTVHLESAEYGVPSS